MRTDYTFPIFTIACTELSLLHRATPFRIKPESLATPNSWARSRVGPLNYLNGQEADHPPSKNSLPFVTATQPSYTLSPIPSSDVLPTSSLMMSQTFHDQLPPTQQIVESNTTSLTTVLRTTVNTVESILADYPVIVDGRVKTRRSQLGKRLKLKLASRVGVPTLNEICNQPHQLENKIRSLVKRYWVDLYQTTLESTPLNDIIGIRVIHDSEGSEECFDIFRRIVSAPELSGLYRFDESTFENYIENPKRNGYQSLHGSLIMRLEPSMKVELQVRSCEMHQKAEYGSAEHSTYKALPSTLLEVFLDEQTKQFAVQAERRLPISTNGEQTP